MEFLKNFDSYDLKARVYPALLAVLPALATVLAWYPDLLTSNVGAAVLTIINTCGLLFLFAELSRSQGQRAQRELLKTWKVLPTTRLLRHSDTTLPKDLKVRYHRHLSTKLGAPLPTAAEEASDPDAADARYRSAILWLIEQCRSPSHFLILNENTSYGFRRNLLGLKPVGVALCMATIAVPLLVASSRYPHEAALVGRWLTDTAHVLQPVQVGACALGLIALSSWLFVVRPSWVKEAAELYALRLLAACDTPATA